MAQFEHLLSPLQIGPIEVRNRVLVSAHVPGYAKDNKPGEQYIDYHRQFARGGVGLQITGGTPVHRSGLLSLAGDGLWNLDDSIVPGYRKLAESVHAEGGRILAQLAHSAGTVLTGQPGQVNWSASPFRSRTTGNVPHEMNPAEIREVVDAYASAARRVALGNMDGVELLAAFGYLPQAFLSPLSNWRTDDYGGTPENRLRFTLETLESIRSGLGDDRILGIRLPGDEFEPGGLDLAQMEVICREIAGTGLVDYISITAHTNLTHKGRSRHWAPTPAPHGLFVPLAAAIRKHVGVPVFAVGRIIDPGHAESIIAGGKADMVGMTRAHICDPEIVKRIKASELARIRPCVGANTCIANRYAGKVIRCMHNPDLEEPGRRQDSAAEKKVVWVAGAGPGGMEAAMIAAERGHSVTLFERSDSVGGQLALWTRAPSMKELGRIVDWRAGELERLEVDVRLGQELTLDLVESGNTDVVIAACGAEAQPREFPGTGSMPVVTAHELLTRHDVSVSNAVVCSDGKGHAGLAAAEWLLHRGVEVKLVTSDFAVAADLDPTHRNAWYERLGSLGMQQIPQHEIDAVNGSEITLKNVFSDVPMVLSGVQLIVDWDGCFARDGLYLQGVNSHSAVEWHVLGDMVAPRTVEIAIAEGNRIARSL